MRTTVSLALVLATLLLGAAGCQDRRSWKELEEKTKNSASTEDLREIRSPSGRLCVVMFWGFDPIGISCDWSKPGA